MCHTSQQFSENNIRGRKAVCDTEVSPKYYTLNTLYSLDKNNPSNTTLFTMFTKL
jgi:hypothetical protein